MLWYIAIIAALNLALGYAWAAFLRPCPRCAKFRELSAVIAAAPAPRVVTRPPAAEMKATESPAASDTVEVVEQAAELPAPDIAAADEAFDAISELAAEPAEPTSEPVVAIPLDPATGLATREHAEQLLEQLAESETKQDPITVALVEVDDIEWIGDDSSGTIDERVLCGVSIIVRESLAGGHTAARFSEQQLLLVVPHEDLQQATRRAEEMRQRIATTSFMADGRTVQTTVTCALAEFSAERSGPRLMDFLREALSEAKRYGGNRTFMHDGNSPTPVVPPELELAPQQLAI